MAGISRYEKIALGLTAAFLLFTGGWFLSEQHSAAPYEVTTARAAVEEPLPGQAEGSEGEDRPDSLLEGEVIDLNTADVYDLQRLPGIGEARARAIVEYREEYGPFRTVEDITRVSGIGDGILAGLQEYVTVSEAES